MNNPNTHGTTPTENNGNVLGKLSNLGCSIVKEIGGFVFTAPQGYVICFYDDGKNRHEQTEKWHAKEFISVSSTPDKYGRYTIKNTTDANVVETFYIIPKENTDDIIKNIHQDLTQTLRENMPNHLTDNQEYFNFLVNSYNNDDIVTDQIPKTVKQQIRQYMSNRGYTLTDSFEMGANTNLYGTRINKEDIKGPYLSIGGQYFNPSRDGYCYIFFDKIIEEKEFTRSQEQNPENLPEINNIETYLREKISGSLKDFKREKTENITFSFDRELTRYKNSGIEESFTIKNGRIYSNFGTYYSWQEFQDYIEKITKKQD